MLEIPAIVENNMRKRKWGKFKIKMKVRTQCYWSGNIQELSRLNDAFCTFFYSDKPTSTFDDLIHHGNKNAHVQEENHPKQRIARFGKIKKYFYFHCNWPL